ncbi:hypothetical protein Rsub_01059 [Raphidocelis subcapitata]|uniref:Potassium channel tetramerisation-type BTB domain-containing protein n=1 Tax=Raphidocelis subcapitata TaxID=307507 RepID=A0A2V0NTU7_9CHLO|nr:hypothetical protein Rsub_01059 [Raphidocelis subcapitata]|eukprot:GBF88347.1 hypothetical protein Rsub_01059 [Raphidocelis subcapitata]
MAAPFVQLNVGGVLHTTTRDTLMREPSSRIALMARGVLPCPTTSDGALFIDRSPRWFQTSERARTRGRATRSRRYYQLTGFEAWLRAQDIASPPASDGAASPASAAYGSPLSAGPASPFSGYAAAAAAAAFARPSLLGVPPPPPRASVWEGSPLLPAGGRPSSALASFGGGGSVPASAPPMRSSSYLPPSLGGPAPLARASSASAALPDPAAPASKFVPQPLESNAFKWTAKYLQTNERMRGVVTTLLELAYLAPHRALHTGKVSITIASECTHDRMTALLGAPSGGDGLRDKLQVVSVKGSSGWAFEMALRPSSELALFDKFSIAEFVQDNWFVLAAILKDEYGIIAEEDASNKPTCAACRRSNVSLTLEKHF